MTIQQAETILLQVDVKIALQHRFAGDKGTILRLDNYAMINIFDDGRYYIQNDESGTLLAAFRQIEEPWDPETWTGSGPEPVLPWFPLANPPKRFEF